jgi:integrase/recombinase XerD
MGAIIDFAVRVERAEAKLEKCSITERNKELILSFYEYKTAQKVKLPRIAKDLGTLRVIAERYLKDRDFTALTSEDIISIIAKVERTGLSDWTKHDYNLILKTFYRWLNRDDIVKVIKVVDPGNKTLPDDLLTEEEVQKMIDAAYTLKDKALIACLYEGGFRIVELMELAAKSPEFVETFRKTLENVEGGG